MWSIEGHASSGGNLYENYSEQPILVNALVHNLGEPGQDLTLWISPESRVRLPGGESMVFTCRVDAGRAITCTADAPTSCRFSVQVQALREFAQGPDPHHASP
jgi:hypothetical protein